MGSLKNIQNLWFKTQFSLKQIGTQPSFKDECESI